MNFETQFRRFGRAFFSTVAWAVCAAAAVQVVMPASAAEPAPSATHAAPVAQGSAPAKPTTKTEERLSLNDAIVIGASVSDGFLSTWDVPLAKPSASGATRAQRALKLRDVLWAVTSTGGVDNVPMAGTTKAINNKSSMMFFMSADQQAEDQIQAARVPGVTQVFALDYLFWHCYGVMAEGDRLTMLGEGLKRLESLGEKMPLVIGDMPDMRHATMMLRPAQIPTVETLAKANEVIAAWVKLRKNVVVVPLTKLVLDVRAGKGIDLGGKLYDRDAAKELLQADGLHATVPGMVAVAIDALERLRDAGLVPKSEAFESDPKVVLARLSAVPMVVEPAKAAGDSPKK